ncbi:hypothetical protein F2P81_022586 [Scophthalmus maximus]|uniref:Uncharacterized protein n=1 Tax=Scophthalmus maximus TaxID=52904 RepID=A0A6A4S0E5_SCOMX|nr:hypothetical protein F2P81_022586 [Scophthalmus maximus]
MKSAHFSGSVSACELSCKTAPECVNMCGMCPPCVFAPRAPAAAAPGSPQCLWTGTDDLRRRFVAGLLLRCTSVRLLEHIQRMLDVTSWSLFAYARTRSAARPRGRPRPRPRSSLPQEEPRGAGLTEIWGWFSGSPHWVKSHYLSRVFSRCDPELLHMAFNLAGVLLVREKRGLLQVDSRSRNANQSDQDTDDDSDDPALTVVPGSSKSASGVSRYRDFVGCLPVDLSKRILGLLDEHTLRSCLIVSRTWHLRATGTMEEIKFRTEFQDQIEAMTTAGHSCKGIYKVSPTYANIVNVPVPAEEDEEADVPSRDLKDKLFEAAYCKIKTKTIQMHERNVYCGSYFVNVLLNNPDPHRVVDYGGRAFLATGSKDCAVRLFSLALEAKTESVLRGHAGGVRAVLLCEDRGLVITGSCDASIRCWNLETDKCEVMLFGHSGTVNCLDVHDNRLVSGAKDCKVKVWNLDTGERYEDFNFKHLSSVQCVKINATNVYSSCDRGLVKIWDMETASLLRVIEAHKSSVKCLFFDEWHLLSGDFSGQVMAWSMDRRAKECLMTFSHPREVKSLTLVYLRVLTGCADGKIRIFNFLTGDCLREITADAESGRLLSLHFHDKSILVNTTSSVKLYYFAKLSWDYESAEGGRDDVSPREDSVSENSPASLRKPPVTSSGAGHMAQGKTMRRGAELLKRSPLPFTPAKRQTQDKERCETAKVTAMLSEKAARERMTKRGLHHPMTRESIHLKVSDIQRAQRKDEVSVNMDCNARLRDSWGPHTPRDRPPHSDTRAQKKIPPRAQTGPPQRVHYGQPRRPKTCSSILKRGASQNATDTDVAANPDTTRRAHLGLSSKKGPPHSAGAQRATSRVATFATSAKERP